LASGTFLPGMLFPYTGSAAPSNLWLLPIGQTLSRTTYATLWAFAQIEIAAGSLLYNNGDGSTTFGIPDMRGRAPAMVDNTGGILDSTTMTPSGNTLGAIGGSQAVTLTASQLPSSIPYNDPGHTHTATTRGGNSPGQQIVQGGSVDNFSINITQINSATTGITINPSGGGVHNNMQPTLLTNYILFAGGPS
jgi:microcystin-dependent protein